MVNPGISIPKFHDLCARYGYVVYYLSALRNHSGGLWCRAGSLSGSVEGTRAWPQVLESIGIQPGSADSASILIARTGAASLDGSFESREPRRDPDPRGTIALGRIPRISVAASPACRSRASATSIAPTSHHLAEGARTPGDVASAWLRRFRERALERQSGLRRRAPWQRRRFLGRGASRRTRLRTLPLCPQSLADLGVDPPFAAPACGPFSILLSPRVDPDYFAARWRKAGISALQVAAWHFYESSDPIHDEYLHKLIEACHRQGFSFTPGWSCPTSARNSGPIIPNGAKRPPSCRTPNSTGASS